MEVSRNTYLGGSDIAAVMGLSPYKTPLQVWAEKTGVVERDETTSEFMDWGIRMEPVLLAKLRDEGHVFREQVRVRHPKYDYMIGHVDGLQDSPKHVFEVKNVGLAMMPQWEAGAPPYYYVQAAYYAELAGADGFTLAALIGGQNWVRWDYERDAEFGSKIIESAREFWDDCIVMGVPPDATARDTATLLGQVFPAEPGEVMEATPQDEAMMRELVNLRAAIADMEERKSQLQNAIAQRMGNAVKLVGDGIRASWPEVKPKPKLDYPTLLANLVEIDPQLQTLIKECEAQSYVTPSSYRRMDVREVKK